MSLNINAVLLKLVVLEENMSGLGEVSEPTQIFLVVALLCLFIELYPKNL